MDFWAENTGVNSNWGLIQTFIDQKNADYGAPKPPPIYFKVKAVPNRKTQNISYNDIEKAWFYILWM